MASNTPRVVTCGPGSPPLKSVAVSQRAVVLLQVWQALLPPVSRVGVMLWSKTTCTSGCQRLGALPLVGQMVLVFWQVGESLVAPNSSSSPEGSQTRQQGCVQLLPCKSWVVQLISMMRAWLSGAVYQISGTLVSGSLAALGPVAQLTFCGRSGPPMPAAERFQTFCQLCELQGTW